MIKQIYPTRLADFIKNSKNHYIPRKLKPNERLHIYKRYFRDVENLYFKVYRIYNVDDVEYYSIKYDNGFVGEISYPTNQDYEYELILDKNNIIEIDNIINTNKCYTGAEIKYWFFIHNINLSSNKYGGFWGFLDPMGQSKIADDKLYFVNANYENGVYKKCKLSCVENLK